MRYKFVPMNLEYAEDMINNWKYEGQYSTNDYINESEDLRDETSWGKSRFAVLNDENQQVGELTVEVCRPVPKNSEDDGFVEYNFYKENPDDDYELWIGFGLRPDLTGMGLGTEFVTRCVEYAVQHHNYKGEYVRLSVAESNQRAKKAYERAGFQIFDSCEADINNKKINFLWMKRKVMVVETRLADDESSNIIRNLYPLYLHDLSRYYEKYPNEYGIFEDEPVKTLEEQYHIQDLWFEKPGELFPYIIYVNKRPAGFALISTGKYAPEDIDNYLFEFFLVRPYRGKNIAETAAIQVFDRFHGKWELCTNPSITNRRAQSFWHKVVNKYTSGNYDSFTGPMFDTELLKFLFSNEER